ncbi:MAG: type IX secretion system sortase PorU [Bacteroidales bacterium]|nr:type IX secretion system sortase PorU [Bacteroidales bacterium]
MSFAIICAMLLFINTATQAQITEKIPVSIHWNQPDTLFYYDYNINARIHFEGAFYEDNLTEIPYYVKTFPVFDEHLEAVVQITNEITEPLPVREEKLINNSGLSGQFTIETSLLISREIPYMQLKLNPLRLNNGKIERLVSAELSIDFMPLTDQTSRNSDQSGFASSSVLASGSWYKIKVPKTGVYKLTIAELQEIGIDIAGADPRNLRIYSNGGGILPENNQSFRHDDLVENPIQVVGEEDGVFNDTDYVLFFASGPLSWAYNPDDEIYERINNPFDDYSYLFLTTDLGPGKRIQAASIPSGTVSRVVTDFPDYQLHEIDEYNLTNTGRTWYGDLFDVNLSKTFSFNFPDLVSTKPAHLKLEVAGRVIQSNANFGVYINNNLTRTLNISSTTQTGYDFARTNQAAFTFEPFGSNIEVKLTFNRSVNSARGWLDYIAINAWRSIRFNGTQFEFRNPEVFNTGTVHEYQIANAGTDLMVWDISDPVDVKRINGTNSSGSYIFKSEANKARHFLAFDGSDYLKAEFVEVVENQNLHAIRDIDYLLITHPDFIDQANRLADIHREQSNLNVFVTIPQKIYNEFSSGAKDITAIRDFNRMLYTESSPGKKLKYLLLLGDASFDYKNRSGSTVDFVPTWESNESLNLVNSIASDDYYGYLDYNEGDGDNNLLDIGIGRFPVSTVSQAEQMVDKIVSYLRKEETNMKPWRNFITFVADDADGSRHLDDAEQLYRYLNTNQRAINFDKIYLDAYEQVPTPGGQKAPAVNDAINKRMDKGTLIMNYSGHGGEVGWTEERILEIADIQGWRNKDKLPIFITATCEFSRYDDHARTSAGEMVFLNPQGGAIAMFTTARATYAAANLALNMAIYRDNMFLKEGNEFPRFGDIIRRSKLNGSANDRKFVLLGDPAIRLAYPAYDVVTTEINSHTTTTRMDTLRALDKVEVRGFVANENGTKISDFNGVIYTTIYDKTSQITTKGDQNSHIVTFDLRNSLIYKGKAAVVNGDFSFSFMMPKDIAYHYGTGRISYYATDYEREANGYYENILIGGFNENAVIDEEGPQISLFMNDTTFVNGGITNENPILLAYVSDESGINTTGAGIGHDITAKVSGASEVTAILNDYYEADLNRSTSGIISYPLHNLSPGEHTLSLKVWDVFNNSSEASISFVVVESSQMVVENLINYPNPFVDETFFVFDHNQAGLNMDIEIQIFDISGRLVKKLQGQIMGTAFRSEPIRWDGTSDYGHKLPKGLYIYRLLATNEKGQQADKSAKLIFYR